MSDGGIRNIQCGMYHSAILKNNGDVWMFGQSYLIGLGTYDENVLYPTLILTDEKNYQYFLWWS